MYLCSCGMALEYVAVDGMKTLGYCATCDATTWCPAPCYKVRFEISDGLEPAPANPRRHQKP